MKNKLAAYTLRLALFIFFACMIMVFFTNRGSAEQYVMIFSCALMAALIAGISIAERLKDKGKRDKGEIKK